MVNGVVCVCVCVCVLNNDNFPTRGQAGTDYMTLKPSKLYRCARQRDKLVITKVMSVAKSYDL